MHSFSSFNRNIVECKAVILITFYCSIFVLIETLWNVKLTVQMTQKAIREGFNRNIVECKVRLTDKFQSESESFNRNIVECKGKI